MAFTYFTGGIVVLFGTVNRNNVRGGMKMNKRKITFQLKDNIKLDTMTEHDLVFFSEKLLRYNHIVLNDTLIMRDNIIFIKME
jgi:hypothetical protein